LGPDDGSEYLLAQDKGIQMQPSELQTILGRFAHWIGRSRAKGAHRTNLLDVHFGSALSIIRAARRGHLAGLSAEHRLLEGLQMGVPCVCHHVFGGTVIAIDDFDEPLGAFRNTVGAEALAEAIAEARTRAGRARETADAVLAEHASSVPGRTMTQRVVDALAERLNRSQEVPRA
jgi:hypothetical protein